VSSYDRTLASYSATAHIDIMSLRPIFSNAFTIHYIIRQRWKCTIDRFRRKTFKLSPQKRKKILLPISKLKSCTFFLYSHPRCLIRTFWLDHFYATHLT